MSPYLPKHAAKIQVYRAADLAARCLEAVANGADREAALAAKKLAGELLTTEHGPLLQDAFAVLAEDAAA